MASTLPSPNQRFVATIRALAEELRADAYVWGTGSRDNDGHVKIDTDETEVFGLPRKFVTDYDEIASDDIVGMLFAAFPNTIQRISVKDYSGEAGTKVAAYLKRFEIRELLLAGLHSSFGLAWVTFYRTKAGAVPFSWEQAEDASRFVPYHLYCWQKERAKESGAVNPEFQRKEKPPVELLPLTPTEMRVAIALAKGISPKEIVKSRGHGSPKTIEAHSSNIYRKLGVTSKKLALRLSEGT
jgi:DNA-binding CsgD family transcriptional regulator